MDPLKLGSEFGQRYSFLESSGSSKTMLSSVAGSPRSLSGSLMEKYDTASKMWRCLYVLGLLQDIGEVVNEDDFMRFTGKVMHMRHVTTVDASLKELVRRACDILDQLENDINPKVCLNSFRVLLNQVYFTLTVLPVLRYMIIEMRRVDTCWNAVECPLVDVLVKETCRGDVTRDFLGSLLSRCGFGVAHVFAPLINMIIQGHEYIQFHSDPRFNFTFVSINMNAHDEYDKAMKVFTDKHPAVRKRSESDISALGERRISFIERKKQLEQKAISSSSSFDPNSH